MWRTGQMNVLGVSKVEYLYGEGIEPKMWRFMDYENVLKLKKRLAQENIDRLLKVHYMERDSVHIGDCYSAIKFNQELLDELKG